MRIVVFMNSAIIGFGQGFQPVCGFNYGAKNYRRVEDAYDFSLKVCFCILLIFSAAAFLFARPILSAFRREDAEVIRIGSLGLRLMALSTPLAAQITMANMFSQTTGYNARATVIALLRQGICLLPFLLLLPPLFGLLGILISQPLSDLLSAVISFFITRSIMQELRGEKEMKR